MIVMSQPDLMHWAWVKVCQSLTRLIEDTRGEIIRIYITKKQTCGMKHHNTYK